MDTKPKPDPPVRGDIIIFTRPKRIFMIRSLMSATTVILKPGSTILVIESATKYEGFEKLQVLVESGSELMLYNPDEAPFYVLK